MRLLSNVIRDYNVKSFYYSLEGWLLKGVVFSGGGEIGWRLKVWFVWKGGLKFFIYFYLGRKFFVKGFWILVLLFGGEGV